MNDCLDCGQPCDERQLCPSCTSRLDVRLGELPVLYRALEAELVPGASGTGTTRRAKAVDAPLPLVEDVLSLRGPGGMVGILTDWVDAFWVGDQLVLPTRVEARLNAAVDLLRGMLPALTLMRPEVGLFADEIRKLNAAVSSIVAPKPKAIRAGYCTATVEDGSECGAVLLWSPGDRGLICRWCQHEYPASMWLQLSSTITERKTA